METRDFLDAIKLEKDIGIEWFKIHADLRLRMINFFLVIAGFCVGGYFTCLQMRSNVAASTVSILLALVCICFKLLDKRTAQLVWHGEAVIESSILHLKTRTGVEIVNPVELAKNRGLTPSYRQTFNLIFSIFGLVSLIGATYPWMSGISK